MGGSAPKTVMPAPTAPTVYQSVVPLQSYQQTGDFLNRLKQQTQDIQEQMYAQSGTPAQLGVRQAATRQQAAGTYLSSLPTGDKYTRANSGVEDQFAPARDVAKQNLSQAQQDYAEALLKKDEKPKPLDQSTPSWATSTIPEGMPGYKA